jgi:hypothetical protein
MVLTITGYLSIFKLITALNNKGLIKKNDHTLQKGFASAIVRIIK